MTSTTAIPNSRTAPRKWRVRRDKARFWARDQGWPWAKFKVREYVKGARDNIYTVFALTCFTTAGFVHSVFTGLIVMGVCWLALELKTRGA